MKAKKKIYWIQVLIPLHIYCSNTTQQSMITGPNKMNDHQNPSDIRDHQQ